MPIETPTHSCFSVAMFILSMHVYIQVPVDADLYGVDSTVNPTMIGPIAKRGVCHDSEFNDKPISSTAYAKLHGLTSVIQGSQGPRPQDPKSGVNAVQIKWTWERTTELAGQSPEALDRYAYHPPVEYTCPESWLSKANHAKMKINSERKRLAKTRKAKMRGLQGEELMGTSRQPTAIVDGPSPW